MEPFYRNNPKAKNLLLNTPDIQSTRGKIQNGETDLRSVVRSFLDAIEAKNAELNIFTQVFPEDALRDADAIQQKIKNGKAGKLAGAVIGIKEAIVEEGRIATAGSRMLESFESVYTATALKRLIDEDAIIIGRLNMDEFAMGSSTENSAFGPTRNPHNPAMVPGGSSGGSAAAIAAGMCNATLGSDTGGSIRQPAALCGVIGLKPTYGRVSRYGLIAYASSFDCIGPLTVNVNDSALLLETLAGRDGRDSTSSDKPVGDYSAALNQPVNGLRIGVPEEYFGDGLDPEIHQRILWIVSELESRGAVVVPMHLPHTRFAIATYYILATAEASSNLARYDGIRYGHRADIRKVKEELAAEKKLAASVPDNGGLLDSALTRLYKQSRTEGFGTEVKRRIMLGTYVLSAGYYDAYYGKAQKIRRLIQNDFLEAFKKADVIISPTSPTTAFPIGAKTDDPLQMYLSDIYTISANLAGIPAISVPAGTHSNGLPFGTQFAAPHFEESRLFAVSAETEKITSA